MNLTKKLLVAGSAVAVTAAGVGVGVAYAAPTASPSPSPSASAAPQDKTQAKNTKKQTDKKQGKNGQHHKKALAKRVAHGEFTLGNAKHTVVDLQRGAVSAVDGTTVTVKSTDGFSQAYATDAKTKVVVISGDKGARKRTPAKVAGLKAGAKVAVVAVKSGETRTAKRIVVRAG